MMYYLILYRLEKMRTKVPRKKIWINGHLVPNPKTAGYKKFLEATLPVVDKPTYGSIVPKNEKK